MNDKIGTIVSPCDRNLTVFLGGAGMVGGYNQEFVDVLTEAGICKSVYGRYNTRIPILEATIGQIEGSEMLGDAPSVMYYNDMSILRDAYAFDPETQQWLYKMGPDPKNWVSLGKDNRLFRIATRGNYSLSAIGVSDQVPSREATFNFIGYSWGAVIAALSARYHALAGYEVDTLALVGPPIEQSLMDWVRSMPNIKNVIVVNLSDQGDPIYAGMDDLELIGAVPTLIDQMSKSQDSGNFQGHFYYSGDGSSDSRRRKEDLVARLKSQGLN